MQIDSEDDDYHHYMDADPENVALAFSSIASSMNKVPAGTDATLTDNIGSNFKITGTDGNQRTYESDTIETITKDGEIIEIEEKAIVDAIFFNDTLLLTKEMVAVFLKLM